MSAESAPRQRNPSMKRDAQSEGASCYPVAMGAQVHREVALPVEADLALRALDAFDAGVIMYSCDLRSVLHANTQARRLLGVENLASSILGAAEVYIRAR